ncbi:unknown protein [Seminavis robusta]|uniref:Uncharacterized protein n=1 Tax=Seminavis robusta TaxID=568900 RepID=A0A9N8ERI6_9STRA|nr:unknown protein [Seminavis robusta]|eukprot:Sro1484_g276481.1  (160) ;mRNA; f:23874-24353
MLLDHEDDVWINNILPFLGMGQYAFVGGVNKKLNQLYKEYGATVKDPPKVKHWDLETGAWGETAAGSTDTFSSAVFYSASCAKYRFQQDDARYSLGGIIVSARNGDSHVVEWVYENCQEEPVSLQDTTTPLIFRPSKLAFIFWCLLVHLVSRYLVHFLW